jgi:phosphoglycerate kinase
MKTLSDFNFKGQRVIVRVDFNVPLDNDYNITDDSRIVAAVPTIKKIINDGGKAILMSHLGRPKTGPEEKFSLKHLINHTSKLMGTDVLFANDCIGEEAMKFSKEMNEGEVLLLENLRFYKEETKGDEAFANKLADLADFYVNDAFGTAHRAHASTAIIAKFFPENKSFGYLMESEIENIEKVLHHAEKPYTAIIGGAKVSDKVLIIENLLEKVDNLLIGGGMAYTFIRAQGGTTGNSLVEEDRIELAKELIVKAEEKGVKLYLPFDSKIADNFDNDAKTDIVESSNIPEGWMGLDIGESAVNQYREVILDSKLFYGMAQWVFSNLKISRMDRKKLLWRWLMLLSRELIL